MPYYPWMKDIYAALGVKRRINAAGTLTRLGGALMDEEVLAAMAAAARASVDIGELQAAASRTISRLTTAEAGIVTTGAAAALTLAAAAAMTRWDVVRMAALPHADNFPNEILVPRTHYTSYAHALRASGARLVDIGHNDRGTGAGVRGLESWEIEAAITPRTAAFAFAANPSNTDDLGTVVELCRSKNIPVIVDAAAQLPPKANLRKFLQCGADLVAFSGGKAIGGPQASGILAGRRDLVGAALVQQLDMDVPPATWSAPELINLELMKGIPHHGLGRGFKVGKEEIVGLLVALERFAGADDEASNAVLEKRLQGIAQALGNKCQRKIVSARETGKVPQLHLTVENAVALSARLQAGVPPVHLSERFAAQGILIIDPQALRPEDDAALAAAVRAALSDAGR
ncbi:MAG TPA: aminotransferase class V-fold PLP-dependent enzyme [Burkholderiales bacterium]|nr:aminotransferase class V-fold PLP-dependent enzyme [Burkholderiales bacterium]